MFQLANQCSTLSATCPISTQPNTPQLTNGFLDTVRKVYNSLRNPICRNVHTNCGHIPQLVQVSPHPKMTRVTKRLGTHSVKCPDTIKKRRNWRTNSGLFRVESEVMQHHSLLFCIESTISPNRMLGEPLVMSRTMRGHCAKHL